MPYHGETLLIMDTYTLAQKFKPSLLQ